MTPKPVFKTIAIISPSFRRGGRGLSLSSVPLLPLLLLVIKLLYLWLLQQHHFPLLFRCYCWCYCLVTELAYDKGVHNFFYFITELGEKASNKIPQVNWNQDSRRFMKVLISSSILISCYMLYNLMWEKKGMGDFHYLLNPYH